MSNITSHNRHHRDAVIVIHISYQYGTAVNNIRSWWSRRIALAFSHLIIQQRQQRQ
jgi:hypothetical protein